MKQQFLFYLGSLIYLPVLPVLYLLGRRVRASVPVLPEAPGNEGRLGDTADPLRILAMGESTVSGVGMPTHEDGFTGWIARHLAQRSGRSVQWRTLARTGYTAAQVLEEFAPMVPTDALDLIVIGLGGNDTFQLNSPLRFKRNMIGLIGAIRQRQPDCPIVIANLPPIDQFPAFPWLVQQILGRLMLLHRAVILDLPDHFRNVYYSSRRIQVDEWVDKNDDAHDASSLFCDGVHASSLTYRIWCREIVNLVCENHPALEEGPVPSAGLGTRTEAGLG